MYVKTHAFKKEIKGSLNSWSPALYLGFNQSNFLLSRKMFLNQSKWSCTKVALTVNRWVCILIEILNFTIPTPRKNSREIKNVSSEFIGNCKRLVMNLQRKASQSNHPLTTFFVAIRQTFDVWRDRLRFLFVVSLSKAI